MSKVRILWLVIGFFVVEGLSYVIGIDKVANQIQIISAIPWFYMFYRIEELHRKHKG
jgi:hypothetical protein